MREGSSEDPRERRLSTEDRQSPENQVKSVQHYHCSAQTFRSKVFLEKKWTALDPWNLCCHLVKETGFSGNMTLTTLVDLTDIILTWH